MIVEGVSYLSSIALFHSLRAPSMSLFLSTKVAPSNSKASILSCFPTSSRWPIRCSTMCRWPASRTFLFSSSYIFIVHQRFLLQCVASTVIIIR